jgi:hypothetical protein
MRSLTKVAAEPTKRLRAFYSSRREQLDQETRTHGLSSTQIPYRSVLDRGSSMVASQPSASRRELSTTNRVLSFDRLPWRQEAGFNTSIREGSLLPGDQRQCSPAFLMFTAASGSQDPGSRQDLLALAETGHWNGCNRPQMCMVFGIKKPWC